VADKLYSITKEFAKKLSIDLKASLKKKLDERASEHKGKKVKSRLEASIEDVVEVTKDGVRLIIKANDYWDVVNSGRKAGPVSEAGQEKIAEWSATRGFAEKIRISDLKRRQEKAKTKKKLSKMPFERAKKQAAFLVARKLKSKALKGTHFVDEILKDGRMDEFKKNVAQEIASNFTIEIKEITKK